MNVCMRQLRDICLDLFFFFPFSNKTNDSKRWKPKNLFTGGGECIQTGFTKKSSIFEEQGGKESVLTLPPPIKTMILKDRKAKKGGGLRKGI